MDVDHKVDYWIVDSDGKGLAVANDVLLGVVSG